MSESDNIIVRRTDLEFEYEDSEGERFLYPRYGQGPGRLANETELARDALGFTNPNLHRRVDPQQPPIAEDPKNQELLPRDYTFNIQNLRSYRTTHTNTHDEESIDSEVP